MKEITAATFILVHSLRNSNSSDCRTHILQLNNKYGGHLYNLDEDMPTCGLNTSSVLYHSNYCSPDPVYRAYYPFNKEQFYEGEFFRDGIHGEGTYKWNDTAVYEGGFYSNHKEGYASVSLPDNSYFEGLFIKNSPFGPGILTYANGRQDAGFWLGKKLVRLSRAVDFIIPRLAPTSAAKIRLLQFRRLIPLSEENWDLTTDILKKCGYPFEHFYSPYSNLIYDSRSIFFDKPAFEKTYFVNIKEFSKEFLLGQNNWENAIRLSVELEGEEKKLNNPKESSVPKHYPCQEGIFETALKDQEEIDICERKSTEGEYEMGILSYLTKFGTLERPEKKMNDDSFVSVLDNDLDLGIEENSEENMKNDSRPPNIVSWNRSELCTEMLKQIFRYRTFEEKLNFNLAKLMLGARTDFRRTGLKEKQSVQFLKMCSIGPAHVVRDLLCNYEISEELMDARGNNSLMFAAATDQHDIIDILLDYGVDVNTFNDENLTPLNLCLLRRLAQANGISSWETAFLPKEIDTSPAEPPEAQQWQDQESISSLDRIFGDGMSINDSKSRIFDSRVLTPFPSPTFCKEFEEMNQRQQNRCSGDSGDLSNLSQITILNISKSPGSHSLIQIKDDDDMTPTHINLRKTASASKVAEAKAELPLGSNEETPKVKVKLIPKSNKRDEFLKSVKSSNTDKYLFAFSFEKNSSVVKSLKVEDPVRSTKVKNKKETMEEEEQKKEEEAGVTEMVPTFEVSEKIAEIDKTIQKLLRRGADPNISEVPKPSIHLGIYTKDLHTVENLLLYGANPNSRLYSNEGLLTPLHIVVLQKSAPEYIYICELLLNFGADPLQETSPQFSVCEEETVFLDPERGRIPLQLLCMRPDLEYADPNNNLIKIGLMLAKELTGKSFYYNGHSCLTLSMLYGNVKLLHALLESRLFDPNEILQKDRGTALHVLVSTELQKMTCYDTSIKMCDLLLAAGANPLKKFRHPRGLRGTCVDYGYREIEAEKEARKANVPVKKDGKKVEKSAKDKPERDYLIDHLMVVEYLDGKALGMCGKRKSNKRGTKGRKRSGGDSEDGDTTGLEKVGKSEDKKQQEHENQTEIQTEAQNENQSQKEKPKNDDSHWSKTKRADADLEATKKGRAGTGGDEERVADKKEKFDKKIREPERKISEEEEKVKKEGKKPKEEKIGKGTKKEKTAGTIQIKDKETKGSEKDLEKHVKNIKGKESSSKKLTTSSLKTLSTKQLGSSAETFPEKLRQELLKMYGNCINIDINEFLVPYVVLRDGELYYRFQGNTSAHKEQYSLI